MIENRFPKQLDSFIAGSAIYKTLFNIKQINHDNVQAWIEIEPKENPEAVVATFDMMFLIGWKNDPSQ